VDLRERCRLDLKLFLETYFPEAFFLPWSDDHFRIIARLQECMSEGGFFALAMPRSGGKTTICVRAGLWAMLYGHRRFATIVSSTEKLAGIIINSIKMELGRNELLCRDFPDCCYAIQRLEGQTRRAAGQTFDGVATDIGWRADEVVLATLPLRCYEEAGGKNAVDTGGSAIRVAAITGAIRGPQRTLASGKILRPDLVILDDPQTRESASSAIQTDTRSKIIEGDVKGLAGIGRKIAIAMPCTVIQQGDLAFQYLDRKKHPEWTGVKTRLLDSLPTNEKLWEDYANLRRAAQQNDEKPTAATDFYRSNQADMDAGAVPTWKHRFNEDEISAVQYAMNLKIEGPTSFYAEYQNEPLGEEAGATPLVKKDEILKKLHGFERGVVPSKADWITGMIDVHDNLHYWIVVAWSANFTGWILDYGYWPEQTTRHFSHQKVQRTLQRLYKNHGREGAILAGLNALSNDLCSRKYLRHDKTEMKIDKLMVDSGHEMDLVYNFCRASKHSSVVMPSRGIGIGATNKPMTEYDTRGGDRIGHHWIIPKPQNRAIRHLRIDTNYWKTFVHQHLAVPLGDPGSLSLFGRDQNVHQMLAEHLTSEEPVFSFGQGREVWQWKLLVNRDNHLLDVLVGASAAASMLGAVPPGGGKVAKTKRIAMSLSEMKRRAQMAGAGGGR